MEATMITEQEAKTKWCPMVRSAPNEAAHCVASNCMMWRWANYGTIPAQTDVLGYCGLAGQRDGGNPTIYVRGESKVV
jgi:hypothetical protein